MLCKVTVTAWNLCHRNVAFSTFVMQDALVGPDTKLELMRVVMQLVSTAGSAALEALDCGDGSAAGSGDQQLDLPVLKGPGDVEMDNAAAACIFTKQQLGAVAARFLRMQLELFGAVEAMGAFHCTSRSRWARSERPGV